MKTRTSHKKNTLIVNVLVIAIVFTSASAATWTQKTDMPTARMGFSTSVVDGKIYAISALQGAGKLNRVEEYDPTTDTWTKKADMPTARAFLATSVVDGKIYAIGGSSTWGGTQLATVEVYDPISDTWTRKADMPVARDTETGTVNGIIYAIGGYRGGTTTKTVEAYDPATDTWTKRADMPTSRELHSISVVHGKIYVMGGQSQSTFDGFSIVEVYDPETDTWTRKGDMPVPRIFSTCVMGDKIYGFGGRATRGGGPVSPVFEYDTATDVWTDIGDLPVRNGGMGVSTVGRRIYVIGGSSDTYPFNSVLSTVWEFLLSPEFDFNEDGVVNALDMSLMVDHWHTDAPSYDLAPVPLGDGIVDVQDLIALSEHLLEDYRVLAHWMLDETEGKIAFDNVNENDATVKGGAVWQPAGGQIEGALRFDGINDHVSTPFVLNPNERDFSVFAWIKGGQPGESVISQEEGSVWLGADVAEGQLLTSLSPSARFPIPPLVADIVITDGNWHRVGLVWDGVDRILYVDDVEVARESQPPVSGSDGGMILGAGADLSSGTFWTGLIDDVLVYDRAVAP